MSIPEKLARIQKNLMMKKIPKTGWNHFQKFHYHELEDLIPPIFEACYDEEVTLFFTFTHDEGILHLKSWKKEGEIGTRDELSVRVPIPSIIPDEENNTKNIQDIGKSITYLKRYLLINTFLILEKDLVDAGSKCNCNCKEKPAEKPKKAPVKKGKAAKKQAAKSAGEEPEKLKNALHLAKRNGGITADNVCYQADMLLKKGVVSKDQSEAIKNYVHEHGVEV